MIKSFWRGLMSVLKFLSQPGTLLSAGAGGLGLIVSCYLFYGFGQLDSIEILSLIVIGIIVALCTFEVGFFTWGDNWPQMHREDVFTDVYQPTTTVDLRKRPDRYDESWSSRKNK